MARLINKDTLIEALQEVVDKGGVRLPERSIVLFIPGIFLRIFQKPHGTFPVLEHEDGLSVRCDFFLMACQQIHVKTENRKGNASGYQDLHPDRRL